MESALKHYEIRIRGKVPERWQAWFDPLSIIFLPDGDTLLRGQIVDQSQLIGIINQVHSLNLTLIAVNAVSRLDRPSAPEPGDYS